MVIHKGNTFYKNGTYFSYGIDYGNCLEPKGTDGCIDKKLGACGFRLDHKVVLYNSTSLSDQVLNGTVFDFAKTNLTGVLQNVQVLYCKFTKTFVMWFSYYDISRFATFYGVATSATSNGSF